MNVRTNRLTVPAPDDSVACDDSVRRAWRKSSYSGGGNNCVEVATDDATVAVRDSKDPEGGELAFSVPAWTAFTTAIRRGGYESR